MSTETNATTTKRNKILGGPFTITLLNRIFAFNTNSGKEAILTLGLVCKQWREAEMFYCHDMWKNVCAHEFGKYVRGQRWSHFSYLRRAKSLLARKTFGNNEMLNEIENCAGDDSNDESKMNFTFRCPMLARNLRLLPPQHQTVSLSPVHQGAAAIALQSSDWGPVLFCDVCEKKVYPFSDPQKAKKFVAGGGDGHSRCVVISRNSEKELKAFTQYRQNQEERKKQNDASSNDELVFNLAVVTSTTTINEQNDNDCGSFDACDDTASRFLTALSRHSIGVGVLLAYSSETDDESSDDEQGRQKQVNKKEKRPSAPEMFISKDLLVIREHASFGYGQLHARIIRIPPAPADLSPETLATKYAHLHPALPDNALGKNNMPTVNGWNAIVIVDPTVSAWFDGKNVPKSTPMRALLHADASWNLFDMKNIATEEDKKKQNNNASTPTNEKILLLCQKVRNAMSDFFYQDEEMGESEHFTSDPNSHETGSSAEEVGSDSS